VPPRLEALVQSLSDKIEQIQQQRGDSVAVDHLEDRIVKLVERLDASDSRLGHLETIERGLADLLVHIEDIRTSRQAEATRADNSPAVDALKHDLARTQNVLEAVNGTLGHVVDRLAMIEKDIRGEQRTGPAFASDTLELTQPVGKIGVRIVDDSPPTVPRMPQAPQLEIPPPQPAPAPMPAPPVQTARPQPAPQPATPQPASRRMPPAAHEPIDPDLPPDQPLEPGSGPPRVRPGARIAMSDAAFNHPRPAPAAPAEGGKSSFIAAARRAAQAAVAEAASHLPRSGPAIAVAEEDEPSSGRGKLMKRAMTLLVASSIVAGVIGTVQILGNMVHRPIAPVAKDVKNPEPHASKNEPVDADEDDGAPEAPAANPLATPKQIDRVPPLTAPAAPAAPSLGTVPFNPNQSVPGQPSLLAPSPLNPQASDVTGSIAKQQKNPPAPRQPDIGPAVYTDRLPLTIGGPKLRSAALAGDSAAAYEVAMRFAEGRGVPASLDEAARWYERAASKGLVPAQFRYASLLEKGQGVRKDIGQARKLYLAAAAKGNAKAMHNLAVLYAEGIDGRPDYATAAQWFVRAAQHGVPDSQYNLGVLAARGLGGPKNLVESYKWFSLAAAQGDKEAARKRDEVAGQLDSQALAAAQQAVASFVPAKQPQDAVTVPEPQGGWDNGADTPKQGKLRSAAPRSLGALNTAKR
jgi:localization factor PodJL